MTTKLSRSQKAAISIRSEQIAADEREAEALLARLRVSATPYGSGDLFSVLLGVTTSIMAVWEVRDEPTDLNLLLGASFSTRFAHKGRSAGPDNPAVMSGAADAGDELGLPLDDKESSLLALTEIRVFFNSASAHSTLRWLSPDGDRRIVVLPAEYDA